MNEKDCQRQPEAKSRLSPPRDIFKLTTLKILDLEKVDSRGSDIGHEQLCLPSLSERSVTLSLQISLSHEWLRAGLEKVSECNMHYQYLSVILGSFIIWLGSFLL